MSATKTKQATNCLGKTKKDKPCRKKTTDPTSLCYIHRDEINDEGGNQQPTTNNQQPTTNIQQSTSNNQQPTPARTA